MEEAEQRIADYKRGYDEGQQDAIDILAELTPKMFEEIFKKIKEGYKV
jgi:hypothetical protein